MFFQASAGWKFADVPNGLVATPSAGWKFADVPNGLVAISKVSAAGWGQILAYMAFCEVSLDQSAGAAASKSDFSFKVLTSSDPAQKRKKLAAVSANGRLTVMAKVGMFFQASAGWKFADVPNGLVAISNVSAAGWGQTLAYMAFCEFSLDQSAGAAASKGDLSFKVLTSSDPAQKRKKLAAESANGRLTVMAIVGMFFPDGLTGSAWGNWALYTASPLRAFEGELGVQGPVGFGDPVGFTADGTRRTSVAAARPSSSTAASVAGGHGLHHSGGHWEVTGLPVVVGGLEVRGRAE